jgi:hypothetical protein
MASNEQTPMNQITQHMIADALNIRQPERRHP